MPPGSPSEASVSAPLSIPLLGGVTLLAASIGGLSHFKQPGYVAYWPISSFRGAAEFGRYPGIADSGMPSARQIYGFTA